MISMNSSVKKTGATQVRVPRNSNYKSCPHLAVPSNLRIKIYLE